MRGLQNWGQNVFYLGDIDCKPTWFHLGQREKCSCAFLLVCLKTAPASSLDSKAHLGEPNFQYWDFKRFSHILNLRVCKITRTYYMKGNENKWMFRQVVPFLKKHKLNLLILGGFYQRVYWCIQEIMALLQQYITQQFSPSFKNKF